MGEVHPSACRRGQSGGGGGALRQISISASHSHTASRSVGGCRLCGRPTRHHHGCRLHTSATQIQSEILCTFTPLLLFLLLFLLFSSATLFFSFFASYINLVAAVENAESKVCKVNGCKVPQTRREDEEEDDSRSAARLRAEAQLLSLKERN